MGLEERASLVVCLLRRARTAWCAPGHRFLSLLMTYELQGRAAHQITCRVCSSCGRVATSPGLFCFCASTSIARVALILQLASAGQMLAIMQANGRCLRLRPWVWWMA